MALSRARNACHKVLPEVPVTGMPSGPERDTCRSSSTPIVRAMADQEKITKAYEEWRSAEAQYADVLAAFGADGPPPKVRKDSALELAKARNRADSARDKYFKRALR